MRLTTKGRFAVTAMLDLALNEIDANGTRKPVTLSDISERQDISLSYLEQLFSRLRRQKLVSSIRGPGGGYNLAKEKADISVSAVIAAVDEHIDATNCSGKEDCHGADGRCMTHDLWASLNKKILDHLSSVSLADITSAHLQKVANKDKDKVFFATHNVSTDSTKNEVAING